MNGRQFDKSGWFVILFASKKIFNYSLVILYLSNTMKKLNMADIIKSGLIRMALRA